MTDAKDPLTVWVVSCEGTPNRVGLERDYTIAWDTQVEHVAIPREEWDEMRTVTDAQCDAIIGKLDAYALAWEGRMFGSRSDTCMGLPVSDGGTRTTMRAIIRAALSRTEAK